MPFKKQMELLICVAGIYACYLTWAIMQERVSTTPYDGKKFKYFVFLSAIQALSASAISYIYILVSRKTINSLSVSLSFKYLQLSTFQSVAPLFGYAATKHLDYPIIILGKACKLIPVMLMNFLIYQRIYPLKKYLIVALITAGVSLFMLLQPSKRDSKDSSLYGILLLLTNLLIDGATNATQEQIFKKEKVSGTSMMMFTNLFSFLLMFLYLVLDPYNNELSSAVKFCIQHPAVLNDILLFGFCGAIGQCFIFHTVEHFGSLVLVTVTVTRKMLTMIISVFLFGHSLSIGQWAATGLVFLGVGMEAFGKEKKGSISEEVVKDQDEKKKQ